MVSFAATTALLLLCVASAFQAPQPTRRHVAHVVFYADPWRQQAGETSGQYLQRLEKMAATGELIKVVGPQDEVGGNETSVAKNSSSSRSKYQRVEEWEEDQQERKKNGTMSWEERVQFDGQRYGNRYNQNEILRKNLDSF